MKVFSNVRARLAAVVLGTATAVAVAAPASAQFTPEDMADIVFPITPTSIGTAIATAGAAILVIVFAWRTGFKLVWKLMSRLIRSV